jgi:hypothetical protein
MSEKHEAWNNRVWGLQVGVTLTWLLAVGALWLAWTGSAVQNMEAGDSGLAVVLTTSCCTMSWVVGLVPIVLCFSVLKR